MAMADDASLDGAGHRARLRQRLFEGGPDALLDHELVEYLLALAIPRRDTKPLAKKLLREFGGFGGLLAADAETIARVGEISEGAVAALKIVQAAALRLLEKQVAERPVLGSWQALLDYLRADMAHEPIERVRVLFLNSKNVLIAQREDVGRLGRRIGGLYPRDHAPRARSPRHRDHRRPQPSERRSLAEPAGHPPHPRPRRGRAAPEGHAARPRHHRRQRP